MLYAILVTIDVLLAIAIIGLVLIQQGKGAEVGAAFGGGASGTVFGARGSASFLTRITTILATTFFINSLVLAYIASHRPVDESVINTIRQNTEISTAVDHTQNEDMQSLSAQPHATDVPEGTEPRPNIVINPDAGSVQPANDLPPLPGKAEFTPDDIPE